MTTINMPDELSSKQQQKQNSTTHGSDKRGSTSSGNTTANGSCWVEKVETRNKKNPKVILESMKVDFPANAVTAILGPSGSGKTTLMNLVTNNVSSNVRAVANVRLPGGTTAFVPQDDRLHGFFTCRAYLKHYARLSGMKQNNQEHDLDQQIDEMLQSMGLKEQANTIVGDLFFSGLSGGQKRRLSIALEAISQPENLILDEPTSGLDAESSLQILEFLKRYVRASPGRRVILTIHQPSSFLWQLMDAVIVLSKGRLMYNGPRAQIEDFFGAVGYPTPAQWNPADHYVTVVNDEFRNHVLSVEEWGQQFIDWKAKQEQEGSSYWALTAAAASAVDEEDEASGVDAVMVNKSGRSKSMVEAQSKPLIPTQRQQRVMLAMGELIYRYFLNLWLNPGILMTRIFMVVGLAALMGALFWDMGDRHDLSSILERSAVLFYCVAFFFFMAVAILPFTLLEREIVDKEVLNSYYNPTAYHVAQAISGIPGSAVLGFLLTLLIVGMTRLQNPLYFFLDMLLLLVAAEAMVTLVSHVAPNFIIGLFTYAGINGIFMLFMGYMLIPSNFPRWLHWTYYTGVHTYSWRTFMYKEFSGQDFDAAPLFETGEDVLRFFEIDDVTPAHDMLVLMGYALIVHIVSCVALHVKYNFFKGRIEKPIGELAG